MGSSCHDSWVCNKAGWILHSNVKATKALFVHNNTQGLFIDKDMGANYIAAMGANYRAGRSLEVVGEESMEVGKANPNPCAKYELAFGL